MSNDECILVVECTSYDIFWHDDLLWGCVTSSNQTLPSEANIISCSMIKVSWREKDSFFILLPDTLAQQSQQYRHKAKSGQATIGRSWFKATKKANAHNSTGYKFIQIRMQWFCEFANPILAATVAWYWHLIDDVSHVLYHLETHGAVLTWTASVKRWGGTCRNLKLSRSLLEMWYVLDSLCVRWNSFRWRKRVSISFSQQLHWKSWLSTECGKLSISRVEEHRPKTSVRKMKKWMSNDECILVVERTS